MAVAELTEDELALAFVAEHPDLRFVQGWGKWMEWDGARWSEDSTLHVYDLVRAYIREYAFSARNPSAFLKAATVAAVERLCRADRAYAATVDQWDADPWMLNTPSGVVDLRTGDIRPHTRETYFTKITGSEAIEGACPRWTAFLDDVTEGDDELVGYLKRLLGYCLTGSTKEHVLVFLHGGGGNGKSTFLNVVSKILGDYATHAPMETFTASNTERHPTDLAMLRGARLVTATETEEGRRWAEAKIKQLTGGDPITARFMRRDFFTFTPTFKLLIAGNHKPRLVNVDEAMRRRLHLVPFEARFKGEAAVKDMEERLLEEAPAILWWMVEGCLEWQANGLMPPERVKAATDAYFANQDTLAEWRAECCETGPGYWETPTRLFNSWKAYAKDAEHPIGTRPSFNDRMEAAGFRQTRDRVKGRHWQGIRLKPGAEQRFDDWTEGRS